jgi:hypothetical protein
MRDLEISNQYTMVDYLRSGWNLSLAIGIDFTGSNGDPQDPSSLHYLSPEGHLPNQYE